MALVKDFDGLSALFARSREPDPWEQPASADAHILDAFAMPTASIAASPDALARSLRESGEPNLLETIESPFENFVVVPARRQGKTIYTSTVTTSKPAETLTVESMQRTIEALRALQPNAKEAALAFEQLGDAFRSGVGDWENAYFLGQDFGSAIKLKLGEPKPDEPHPYADNPNYGIF